MEHVKKVDPGPGERWVDLYDALRINPTIVQALHTVLELFENAIIGIFLRQFNMSKIVIIDFLGEAWLLLW